MSTLSLKPEAAAARAARKAASGMPEQAIVAPEPPRASRGGLPASQENLGLSKTEDSLKLRKSAQLNPQPSKKAAKKQAMRDLQRKLKATWGHLFGRNDIPLAIGIRHDIARHLSAEEVKLLPAVLHQHVHRAAYINALMQPGAHRCGLDGSLEPVSQKDAEHARVALDMPAPPIVQQRATMQAVGVLPVRATSRRKAPA